MSRANKSGAIWLRAESGYAIVCIEREGQWIEIIREYLDSPFSHIVEPSGIEAAITNTRGRNREQLSVRECERE